MPRFTVGQIAILQSEQPDSQSLEMTPHVDITGMLHYSGIHWSQWKHGRECVTECDAMSDEWFGYPEMVADYELMSSVCAVNHKSIVTSDHCKHSWSHYFDKPSVHSSVEANYIPRDHES